ncbi:MAG: hypothetical protein ACLS5G_05015 [Streptococcus sp.]
MKLFTMRQPLFLRFQVNDEKLSAFEKRFEKGEADFDLLTEYCDFMEDYL